MSNSTSEKQRLESFCRLILWFFYKEKITNLIYKQGENKLTYM